MKAPEPELRLSDHALIRFMERAGGVDMEAIRSAVQASLARAHEAAATIGARDYLIQADGLVYCVRRGTVTTVLEPKTRAGMAGAMEATAAR